MNIKSSAGLHDSDNIKKVTASKIKVSQRQLLWSW